MNVPVASDRLNYAPSSSGDLARPLDFLVREHDRYRVCCDLLMRLADDPSAETAPEVAELILDFVENVMPSHIADEEEDLFPLLRRAYRPDGRIGQILDRLCCEHGHDIEAGRWLINPLRRIAAGATNAPTFSDNVRSFVTLQRQHLEWENVLVLPLAYTWLSEQDLGEMWRGMAARRGLLLTH